SLRGFSASPVTGVPQGISVFVDGVRVNEPAAEEVSFELIPLADIERIEIVRGPNAIFGRNTLGGAIHILTRRGGREPEASVQIEGGSWEYQEARGVISGPLGPLSGYLSLSEFSDQGWRVRGAGNGVRVFGKLGAGQEGAGATLQLDHRMRAGALQNRLSAGLEAMRSAVRLRVHEEANPRFTTSEDGKPLPRLTSDLYDRQWASGGFVQEQARIVDGPFSGLAATAALRFDRI